MDRRSFVASMAAAGARPLTAAQPPRPNILLILADDLGFSDLGCYGGEMHTPNLDRLAAGGIRFTQMYNTARCCPSRASLMTGLYPHQTGIGAMTGGKHQEPGYRGQLNDRCTTIPQLLRDSGYSTLMAGKWHLGQPGPDKRGFEEFYGMVHGFDSFWNASRYTRLPAGRPARTYPEGAFYSTNAITDHAIDFLGGARKRKQPWFLYLAYNAPHFPLHAAKDVIDKYQAVYEQGWDKIRETRFARMRELGILDPRWELSPRSVIPPNRVATPHGWANKQNPAWDSIEPDRRKDLARRMAIFAAMVEIMDRNIGRVFDDLRAAGEMDNTVVFFLSDNGACAEWDPWGFDVNTGPENILHKGEMLAGMGQPGTYHSYGSGWANACNTPWRIYKHYAHEGGITTPFIAHWPKGIKRRNVLDHQPLHLIDFLPTCTELAGARYPGAPILPSEGLSMTPALAARKLKRDALYFEHEGNRAIREGKWKLVALDPGGKWELYDMEGDRTEMHDLAPSDPGRVRAMIAKWNAWAKRTNTIPWPWTPQYGSN